MRVGYTIPASSFDPTKPSADWQLDGLSLEPLVWMTPDGKPQLWLAQSVTQPGPAVYVYHLRHGVKFWDGNEMTGVDVANALNYYRYPTSLTAPNFSSVRSIIAKDRYTVVVTLKRRDASWPATLSTVPGIYEKAFQDAHRTTFGQPGTLVMGTGPWMVERLDAGSKIEYSANPHYWRGPVSIKRITVSFFSDDSAMGLALRAGAIDFGLNVLNVNAFASSAGAKVVSVPATGVKVPKVVVSPSLYGLTLSMNVLQPPWNDVHVRRAVAYALNRQEILAASGSPGRPRDTLIPASMLYALAPKEQVDAMLKTIPKYTYNLAKARQELAQSAYPNGFSNEFNTIAFAAYPDMAQVVAAQLGKIGIKLKVNVVSIGQWVNLIAGTKRGLSGIQFTASCCNNGSDPAAPFVYFVANKAGQPAGFNPADYAPPAVLSLLSQAKGTLNPVKRVAIYGQVFKRIATDAVYIGIFDGAAAYGASGKLVWPVFSGASGFRLNGPWPLDLQAQ